MTTAKDLQKQFHCCMPLFIALGDKVRLSIVELLSEDALKNGGTRGTIDFEGCAMNVNEITRRTSLSRCSRSKFLTKLLKTFDKTFREIFPVFISTKRREKPSAFFDNNFVNNAYFSEAASSSSSHLASSSSKAPISSRMTCLCLWSS